jgi:hypothetical protein
MPRFLRIIFVALGCAATAFAQSARWEPAGGTLPRDQTSQLALVFDNCEPASPPVLPSVPGLEFGKPNRSQNSSFNLSFGSKAVSSKTITYTYPVRPTQPDGEVRIPAFTITTDEGAMSVAAAGYRIVAATLGQTGLGIDEVVKARIILPSDPVWAGEVFPLRHTFEIDANRAYQSAPALEWPGVPLSLEDWSAPKPAATNALKFETRTTRALAPASGPVALPLSNLLVGIATGTDIFGRPTGDRYNVSSAPVTLEVRPLPAPAPAERCPERGRGRGSTPRRAGGAVRGLECDGSQLRAGRRRHGHGRALAACAARPAANGRLARCCARAPRGHPRRR